MNNKIALLFTITLYWPLYLGAQEIKPYIAEQNSQETIESTQDSIIANQKSKASLLANFYRFLRIFIILLSNEKVQNNIKLLNQMLVSLVQTAAQIAQNTLPKAIGNDEDNAFIEALDPAITQEMVRALTLQSRMIVIIKNRPTATDYDRQDKEEVQAILNSFAGVMQGFFTIVQEPENKENVMSGIAGMLGSIIAAGKVIMKGADLSPETDRKEIKQRVASLDAEIKEQIMHKIQQRRQFIRISHLEKYKG